MSEGDPRFAAQQAVRDLRALKPRLDEASIDVILRGARTHYAWTDRPVPHAILESAHAIMSSGPTSMNCSPARFVFVTSNAGKERLAPALKEKNIPKMRAAPVTVIIAYDVAFWRELPFLFPHEDRRSHFEGKVAYSEETAFRNSTLQAAYLMIAARALGLDVAALSGFSNQMVDAEFFSGTTLKSNFLCCLGYADETALFQRLPRLAFEKTCSFV